MAKATASRSYNFPDSMNKPSAHPMVTFGVPTVNSEKRLSVLLDSLLAQTYEDFKILISDNASTDRTNELCKEYAANDSRISVFRQPEHICMRDNFKFLLDKADTKYFSWQSDDDFLADKWLETTIELLNANPVHCMAFTNSAIEFDGDLDSSPRNYDLADSFEGRIRQLSDISYRKWLFVGFNGLWQFGYLQKLFYKVIQAHNNENLQGSDMLMIFTLMVERNFSFASEKLFTKRYLSRQRTYNCQTYGQRYRQEKSVSDSGTQYMTGLIKSLGYGTDHENKLITLVKNVAPRTFSTTSRLRLLKWRLLPWYKVDGRTN